MILRDRGLVKWAPYKSLVEQEDYLQNTYIERNKVSKPILLEDKIEELNYIYQELKKGQEIKVKYFQNGFIYYKEIRFIKIDVYLKKLIGEELYINLEDVLDVELI